MPSRSPSCASAGSTSTIRRRRSSTTATGCWPWSPVVSRSRCWRAEVEWSAARGLAPDGYVGAARAAGRRARNLAGAASPSGSPPTRQLKRRRGVVDLDDLLAMAARQLADDPSWAEIVRWRYRHVLVDEAQDLNPMQHRLLELVVGGRDDLYLVGDPAQAIYGFNGADPTLLTDVAARLHGVEVIHLPTNHRSTPQIVAAGIHVLRDSGLGEDAVSSRATATAVRVVAADDEEHEAALVAAFVRAARPGPAARRARGRAGPHQRPADPAGRRPHGAGLGGPAAAAGGRQPAGPRRAHGHRPAVGESLARLGPRRARRRGGRPADDTEAAEAARRRGRAGVPARPTVRRRRRAALRGSPRPTRSRWRVPVAESSC